MQRIIVFAGVAEEAVVRIEHLLREEMKPFSRHSAVIQPFLPAEFHHKPFAKVLGPKFHHTSVGFLQQRDQRHCIALHSTHFGPFKVSITSKISVRETSRRQ